jgi:hypothetical protein
MIYGSLQQRMIALATLITLATAAQDSTQWMAYEAPKLCVIDYSNCTENQKIDIAVTQSGIENSFKGIQISNVAIIKNRIQNKCFGFKESDGNTYMCQITLQYIGDLSKAHVAKFNTIRKNRNNKLRKKWLSLDCSIPLPKGSVFFYDGRIHRSFKKKCLPKDMFKCVQKTSIELKLDDVLPTGERCTIEHHSGHKTITLKFNRFGRKEGGASKNVLVLEPVKETREEEELEPVEETHEEVEEEEEQEEEEQKQQEQ